MTGTCKDCKYGNRMADDPASPVECRESSPQIVIMPVQSTIQGGPPQVAPVAIFPQLPPDGWCGRFLPRTPEFSRIK